MPCRSSAQPLPHKKQNQKCTARPKTSQPRSEIRPSHRPGIDLETSCHTGSWTIWRDELLEEMGWVGNSGRVRRRVLVMVPILIRVIHPILVGPSLTSHKISVNSIPTSLGRPPAQKRLPQPFPEFFGGKKRKSNGRLIDRRLLPIDGVGDRVPCKFVLAFKAP